MAAPRQWKESLDRNRRRKEQIAAWSALDDEPSIPKPIRNRNPHLLGGRSIVSGTSVRATGIVGRGCIIVVKSTGWLTDGPSSSPHSDGADVVDDGGMIRRYRFGPGFLEAASGVRRRWICCCCCASSGMPSHFSTYSTKTARGGFFGRRYSGSNLAVSVSRS